MRTQVCSRIQQSSFGLFASAARLCQPNLIKEERISPTEIFPIQINAQRDPEKLGVLTAGRFLFLARTILRKVCFSPQRNQSFKVHVSDFHP